MGYIKIAANLDRQLVARLYHKVLSVFIGANIMG